MTQRQSLSQATTQVAKQYVARGYELVRKANQDRLPPSLAFYSPDLVASRGVLVWTVIEASLRHLVEGATGEGSPMPLPRLLKEALSLGLLTKRLWTYLGQLLMLRNRLVHGESVAKNVDRKAFERARNLAMRLVDRVGEHPADGHNGHLQSR